MKPTIYNVATIGQGSLAMMAKPTGGEWIEDTFAAIAQSGITHMVSLLEAAEVYELGLRAAAHLSQQYEIKFTSYPLPDRGLPSSIVSFARFSKGLHSSIVAGDAVVIHCRAGIGRTGLVAAGILLHTGLSPNQAFDHVSQCRGVSVPDTPEQQAWLSKHNAELIAVASVKPDDKML